MVNSEDKSVILEVCTKSKMERALLIAGVIVLRRDKLEPVYDTVWQKCKSSER